MTPAAPRAAARLGLTGGIGSGKSTVAGMLAERGAAIVDADAISRATTATGGTALPAIAQAFGRDFITQDGALDRDRMRAAVFADGAARKRLEAIVHPLVGQETERQAQAALHAGSRLVVFDVPLLVESGTWPSRVDAVLVVDCEVETQIRRVIARSRLERAEVERIIASQASRAERLAAADIVVYNDGIDLPVLRNALHAVAASFGL